MSSDLSSAGLGGGMGLQGVVTRYDQTVAKTTNLLKTKHDTVKSSITNVR